MTNINVVEAGFKFTYVNKNIYKKENLQKITRIIPIYILSFGKRTLVFHDYPRPSHYLRGVGFENVLFCLIFFVCQSSVLLTYLPNLFSIGRSLQRNMSFVKFMSILSARISVVVFRSLRKEFRSSLNAVHSVKK